MYLQLLILKCFLVSVVECACYSIGKCPLIVLEGTYLPQLRYKWAYHWGGTLKDKICTFDEGTILYQQVLKTKRYILVPHGTNHVLKGTNWNGTNVFLYIKVQLCTP